MMSKAEIQEFMENTIRQISKRLDDVAILGVPSSIIVWDSNVIPVLVCNKASVLLAVKPHHQGRIAVVGHSHFGSALLNRDQSSPYHPLLNNLLAWLSQVDEVPSNVEIACADIHNIQENTPEVLVATENFPKDKIESAVKFVMAGGRLVIAATPWAWLKDNRKCTAGDFPLQLMLQEFGLCYNTDCIERPANGLAKFVNIDELINYHAGLALERVSQDIQTLELYGDIIDTGLQACIYPSLITKVRFDASEFCNQHMNYLTSIVPTGHKPVTNVIERGLLNVVSGLVRALQLQIKLPGVEHFPGIITDPRVDQLQTVTLEVISFMHDVHPMGYYVPPGTLLKCQVLECDSTPADWKVRIGCHSDRLNKSEVMKRWPQLVITERLQSECVVFSPWGGLIYLVSPEKECKIKLRFRNILQAPYFDVNEAKSVANWSTRRNAPGLWTDIVGGDVILTVPSATIRNLDSPMDILDFWDMAVWYQHQLRGTEPISQRRQWLVADVQTTTGTMHSGYPIVSEMSVVDLNSDDCMLNGPKLSQQGHWPLLHQLGHNMQRPEWTFLGTGEVTCNVFALYVMEAHLGMPSWMGGKVGKYKNEIINYLQNGADYEEFKKQPFVGLALYSQLAHHLGWSCFQRMFRRYETMTAEEKPNSDQEKIDTFIRIFSTIAALDLRPVFAFWGIPFSNSRLEFGELTNYPMFLPDDEITAACQSHTDKILSNYIIRKVDKNKYPAMSAHGTFRASRAGSSARPSVTILNVEDRPRETQADISILPDLRLPTDSSRLDSVKSERKSEYMPTELDSATNTQSGKKSEYVPTRPALPPTPTRTPDGADDPDPTIAPTVAGM